MLVIFLLLYGVNSQAQLASYSMVHFTTEDGLPQNSVTAIQFDKWGYCWLGTEDGLVRFNGKSFTVFNSENTPGLTRNRVRIGAKDDDGNLFFQNERLEQMEIKAGPFQKAPVPAMYNSGGWIPTRGGKMLKPGNLREQVRKVYQRAEDFNNAYNSGFRSSEGDTYVFTMNRLYFVSDSGALCIDSFHHKEFYGMLNVGGVSIVVDDKNVIAYRKSVRQKSITAIQGPAGKCKDFKNRSFERFQSEGHCFMYGDNTLYELYLEKGQVQSRIIFEDLVIPTIGSLYYNAAQDKYYFGSLITGLYIVTPSAFRYPRKPRQAIDEGFYSQLVTSNGDIICNRYYYTNDTAFRLPMNRWVGASMYLSPQQQIYYGDGPELFKFDLNKKTNQKLLPLDSRPASIFRDITDSNAIILSTSFAVGKLVGDSIQLMRKLPGNQTIMSTFQTGKDSFVIATQQGVHWFDLQRTQIYRSLLDSFYIRSVYTEPNGRTWISTMGRGFFLYDEKGKLHEFPVQPFNALKTIHAFVEDGSGNFWLPTNDGLFTVKKQQLLDHILSQKAISYYKYSVADQLLTNEFNGGCIPAYQWLKDSVLSLPSIQGIVQFQPRKMKPYQPSASIYIESILLNNHEIKLPEGPLMLEPSYSRLSLTVSCPYFGDRENLQLLYMIEGLDKEWQPVPGDNKIVVSRLLTGDYNILVRKQNSLDDEATGLSIPFSVSPWFYQTWWFYLLVAVVVTLVSFYITWFRARMLQQRNRKLKEIITRQTEDLSKTVAQLKLSEQELKASNQMKDRVTAMVLHDLRSPVRFLHTISKQLLQYYDTMTEEERKHTLSMLKNSTGSLNDFTEQFFVWAASQHKGFRITIETFELNELFVEMQELYADIVSINGNKLVSDPIQIRATTDRQILAVMLRNLVDNANKSTYNGTITLSATISDGQLEIAVADTGKGLSEAAIEDFYNDNDISGNRGNGSTIVKTLLQKIGGSLKIEVEKGKGTTFLLRFPQD
ncbi:MAG: ATP-binding protein [Pseudobacter sp.]|uniref:sensor histidine kinase n=1 Tax=Pseudobacter sp. TaxID=2045420 RepID=UPI003F7ED606